MLAPIKTFTMKSNYKFGLSENTKKLMKDRDSTRSKISAASSTEKTNFPPKIQSTKKQSYQSNKKGEFASNVEDPILGQPQLPG